MNEELKFCENSKKKLRGGGVGSGGGGDKGGGIGGGVGFGGSQGRCNREVKFL